MSRALDHLADLDPCECTLRWLGFALCALSASFTFGAVYHGCLWLAAVLS